MSRRRRCFCGSNAAADGTRRFDLRKKEKNATKHAAQNVASSETVRSSCSKILLRMAGVIGSFCETVPLFVRIMPRMSKVF